MQRTIISSIRHAGLASLSITLLGILVLVGLGTWQLYRLSWKKELIARIETRFQEAPFSVNGFFQKHAPQKPAVSISSSSSSSFSVVGLEDLDTLEFRSVTARGTFLRGCDLKLQGKKTKRPSGELGYHVLTPLKLNDTLVIWVDRGWVSSQKEPLSSSDLFFENPQDSQNTTLTGYIRLRTETNFMTPRPLYDKGEVYSFDPLDTLSFFKKKLKGSVFLVAPFYIVQTGPDPRSFSRDRGQWPSPLPVPSQKQHTLRNFHLQYAITWYTLAFILGIVYLTYILDFSRKKR